MIAIESVSCIVPTETSTGRIDYRNFNQLCKSSLDFLASLVNTVVTALAEDWVNTYTLPQILHVHFMGFDFTDKLCLLHISFVLLTLTGALLPRYYFSRFWASFSSPLMSLPLTPDHLHKAIPRGNQLWIPLIRLP